MRIFLLVAMLLSSSAYAGTPLECRTKLVGWKSKADMSKNDLMMLETARAECPKRKPNKPCVVIFQLKGFQDYYAECGYLKPKLTSL